MIEQVAKDLENVNNAIRTLSRKRYQLKRVIENLRYLYQQDCIKEKEDYEKLSAQINKLKKIRYKQKKTIKNIKEIEKYVK